MLKTFINQIAVCILLVITAFNLSAQTSENIQVIYYADVEPEEKGYQFQGDFDVLKIPATVNFENRLKIEYKFGDQLTQELPENRIYRAFSKMTSANEFVGFFQYKIKEHNTIQKNCIVVTAANKKELKDKVLTETDGNAYDIKVLDISSPLIMKESYTEALFDDLNQKVSPILDPIQRELLFREKGTITGTDY